MELDSESLDSNEGADLSIKDNDEELSDDFPPTDEAESAVLEAKTLYLLLPKNVPVSRTARLQWLLDHLNTVIRAPGLHNSSDSNDIEIVSAVPREPASKCTRFLVNCRTEVVFLARTYRFVYCLDMSPSQSVVDIEKGEILFDESLAAFKASVTALTNQFAVPGSSSVFQPTLYLTVIVNTPFFMSPAQQVLVKGVEISPENLSEVVGFVEKQFHLLEGKIASETGKVHEQTESQRLLHEGLGGLFDPIPENEKNNKTPMVSPDANFVNMLRYSMLAVSLLPENSISHILVITDGVVAMPDSNIMESLLFQLHYDGIAVSFIKVGSPFHPHSSAGYISYTDLLIFISRSTMGTCMESCPEVLYETDLPMNAYHELFLLCSFHSTSKHDYRIRSNDVTNWGSLNDCFYSHKTPVLLSKRHSDENTSASILLLLSRRLREGFSVDNMNYLNGVIEIQLSLQWKSQIYIIYKVSSQWPVVKNNTHVEVFISAPYEFLHDITCIIKKDPKSSYRQAIIDRFWLRLTQLSSADLNFAQHLSVFQNSSVWYNLPESVRSGIPVFNLNSLGFDKISLTPSSTSCARFVNVWQPICQMETSNWRKWFHTHKVSIILRHDSPLPRHLHLPNSSQRFQVVQCRQAATALYGKLADWASFVLVDNHTYLKLLHREANKPPTWFCIVRITSKLPCAVLNIGFVTNTPGYVRHETVEDLKRELAALSYMPSPGKVKENVCCVILQKPLEKILIRYERMPSDFSTVIFPDGTQPAHNTLNVSSPLTGSLFTTLSRYLYHKRWIWSAAHASNQRLPDNAISRILNTLTRMRIKEGFSFAHSSSGIITMVLELWMDPQSSCLVQYVLFPPHRAWWSDDLLMGSDEETDLDLEHENELQLVTEVWIEPQFGKVMPTDDHRVDYMTDKHYYELADVISGIDMHCINSLLTMEHLSLMCQDKCRSMSVDSVTFSRTNSTNIKSYIRKNSKSNLTDLSKDVTDTQWHPINEERIEHIPFNFDAISILPLCQQTELLFSMFIERKERSLKSPPEVERSNKVLMDNIQEHLSLLHDKEIFLSREESDKFCRQILNRHKNVYPYHCPISEYKGNMNPPDELPVSQWRCFIKGISVTHVILTFIPATLTDLKSLVHSDSTNIPSPHGSTESVERTSSRGSNYSDVPINVTNSLTLPVYVYDCPLGMLVHAHVTNTDEEIAGGRDVYQDHRFKTLESLQDDILKLKSEDGGSPENKSDESESTDNKSSARHHCRTLVLVHSKCFTISLFMALHSDTYVHCMDVQSAMDQCEETVTEIDVTEYVLTICGHVKHHKEDRIDVQLLRQTTPCNELRSLHALIKEKFFRMVNVAFIPVPTNAEFYFCRYYNNNFNRSDHAKASNNSDDEISNPPSDKEFGMYSEPPFHALQRFESATSDAASNDVSPLFLHLVCTMRFNNGDVSNTSVRVLPTCLGELTGNMDVTQAIERRKLQVTLDILCLTLPTEVQNVITEYSSQGLRTTSFCSDGFQPSIASTTSEASFNSEFPEPLTNLPEYQRKSIILLRDEIKWLLKDEIATSLLDIDTVSVNTLNFIMKHVTESRNRSSCLMDVIHLNFVFGSAKSHLKFVEEFAKIKIPHYKLLAEEELHYLAKDVSRETSRYLENGILCDYNHELSRNQLKYSERVIDIIEKESDVGSQQSDTSSVSESVPGTDGTGYDEDVSNDDEDYEWLLHLSNKRQNLPNFWLVMKVEPETVTIYFHCRFLELPTTHVDIYLEVHRKVRDEIKELCKKVNQSLLLQSLYESKICDPLLEAEDNLKEWHTSSPVSRNPSYLRLRSMEEGSDEVERHSSGVTRSEACANFTPGYFRCPVVWYTNFILNPRLKTGPGKSGISRGILALKNILDKFSVSNRNNMFVYRDSKSNVFYLRLHENVQNSSNKNAPLRPNEYENAFVSRSPSIASLPLDQTKSQLSQCESSLCSILSDDIRPRVRSFGEKESKDPIEDTLILNVHGITEAGTDVQCDLVQVLQNRLDDAVLDFLSVMLARNAMCPLAPEDVHFIQKPFRLPECIIRCSMQDFVLEWMDSFIHYLKQNLLQFLNIPKYTDSRSHYRFKDYSESEQALNRVIDDNIFIYNQSQNPATGNRGIACIALAVINNSDKDFDCQKKPKFDEVFDLKSYQNLVASKTLDGKSDPLPPVYLEFRLWKQGRVNVENLSLKLREAISQATWDIVMEYQILRAPLCDELDKGNAQSLETVDVSDLNLSREVEFNCVLDLPPKGNIKCANKRKLEPLILPRKRQRRVNPPIVKATRSITFDDYDRDKENHAKAPNNSKPTLKLTPLETGDEGVLSRGYAHFLPAWLEFGSSIAAPSVRKQKIALTNAHSLNTTVKELLVFLQDAPKAFKAIPSHALVDESDERFVSYDPKQFVQKCVIIGRNFDHWKASIDFNDFPVFPDFMSPHALKHTQKFVPTCVGNNKFIPRQKILWIFVQSDSINIYTYNWARDNVEKLIMNCSKLGQWLSVRSCFLNSLTSQKLGLFHNQAITQKSFLTSNNPYTSVIGMTTAMAEFPREEARKNLTSGPNLSSLLEASRDSFHTLRYGNNDPVVVFTVELYEMKMAEKKSRDEMKKLHSMYQSRTSTTTVPQIFLLMQNSRIIHYCHTPLLFLPSWRLKSAATRDHSLCPLQQRTSKCELEKDSWHTELCYGFFCEYRRYLQTLGFMPLQIDNSNKKTGIWARDNSSFNSVFYIQKTIMGGILLFTVEFNEPFFTSILHAIECNRLQTITSRASINRFTLCFLDECDRVKILMHLHSFTYDYHLRGIYNYISNIPGVHKVCDKYDVIQFLDDFMKYYNKAPNFARNLIHADTITIKNLVTEGKQLYDYLLSNVGQYSFEVIDTEKSEGDSQFILVQVTSTPQVSYKDAQDRQRTDDFEITLVVYNLCSPYNPTDNVLHLKYYLILTSKCEIYPKSEIEQKLGKFRTVSSTARSLSALEKISSDLESSLTKSAEVDFESSSSDERIMFSSDMNKSSDEGDRPSRQSNALPHVEISQESVNYLGYYSSHEQLMQQLILDKANTTQKQIQEMVAKGMVHCRTHLLWNKLVSNSDNSLTYDEFMELKGLARLEHLCDVHPNLGALLDQSLQWYQSLAKLLLTKYSEHHRTYTSADGNIEHFVILHPHYFGAFMLLTLDLHTERGELYAVYREPNLQEDTSIGLACRKSLLEGFVNCICFYLWHGLI